VQKRKNNFIISNLEFKLSRGVTLIEFLAVILIIVILVAISIPVWRNIQPTLELNGSCRELVTDLRYAQQLSIAEQIIYGVRFNFAENKYQIIQYKKTDGTTENVIKSKFLPEGIDLEQVGSFSEAKFTPYGSVMESGEVRLVNAQNQIKTIDIRPSGFVKVD